MIKLREKSEYAPALTTALTRSRPRSGRALRTTPAAYYACFVDRNTPTQFVSNPTIRDTVEAMRQFAHKGKEDLEVRRHVEKITHHLAQGDYASEILAIYHWVCQHVRYMRDIDGVEFVKEPIRTIETQSGDCDDMATLLAAMLMSCGNRCRFVLSGFGPRKKPSHIYCEVFTPGGWVVLDPVANRETAQMLKDETFRKEVPV